VRRIGDNDKLTLAHSRGSTILAKIRAYMPMVGDGTQAMPWRRHRHKLFPRIITRLRYLLAVVIALALLWALLQLRGG
jgi:hypothetical protein